MGFVILSNIVLIGSPSALTNSTFNGLIRIGADNIAREGDVFDTLCL